MKDQFKFESRSDSSEEAEAGTAQHACPYCNYTSTSEMRIQAHVLAQHGASAATPPQQGMPSQHQDVTPNHNTNTGGCFQCPLCQDAFKDRPSLERHVMQIHSVNSEGLQRLLMLVDQSHWLNQVSRTPTPSQTPNTQQTPPNQLVSPSSVSSKDSAKLDKSDANNVDLEPDLMSPASDETTEYENERCSTCFKNFRNIDELCFHQNETGHLEIKQTPSGPGYVCWKKGCNQYFPTAHSLQMHFKDVHAKNSVSQMSVSEKHVYKYRCNQCSLAFKTLEKLQLHSQYHLIRDATKCVLCGRSFRSVVALHKHVETVHSELTDEELAAYKQSLMNNPLLLAGLQGQVLDSSTNELLKKESMRDDTLLDASPGDGDDAKDASGATDASDANQTMDGDNSDDSIVYKDQQFLEDYLNSQAIAEDSYNDPNRKYKCHRCKVAFTRQSYLTAHNKTLLHRKGEKLSYPMEKYLDPNRPYKCDVCKESFTQKNILLVHYNSVSHLHKLKRAMQEQQQQNNNNNPAVSPVLQQPTAAAVAAAAGQQGRGGAGSPDEDDKKRYKCNICKVAYTQGSTLDIHMRSVLHQTRASKLQDLALAGQIDLTKPLIEQPDAMAAVQSPKQPVASQQPSPVSVGGGEKRSPTPASPGPAAGSQAQGMFGCSKCGALFGAQDQLSAHQQLYCMFAAPMAIFQQGQEPGQAKSPPPGEHDLVARLNLPRKTGSHMYKHLLESFGFDLVMQFNENHQRRQREEEQRAARRTPTPPAPPAPVVIEEPAPVQDVTRLEEEPESNNLPEVSKSTCQHCNKEFSSVWVLKSHCEEIHKDLVPLEFLEKYAQQFKNEYEKKTVVVTAATSSTLNTTPRVSTPSAPTTTTPSADANSPDKEDESKEALHAKLNLQQQAQEASSTAPSTPTSIGTPVSSADTMPANIQAILAQSMAQNPMALAQQMNEMQAALNVMQLQQLNFNPMMQMMGMGLPLGLNALAAMNLQPPLVPLMMPPPPYADPINQYSPQDQQMMAKQQAAMLQQQQAAANAAANQKRARTRITDDQLKILRAHFDINNSPSEEQIHEMAGQSGLPPKVIKHWFRNTLFKERQRNKDSPYNFNNPPSTTLNLEEYEKTGEAKVMQLNSSVSDDGKPVSLASTPQPEIKQELKEEPADDVIHHEDKPINPNEHMIDEKPNIFNLPSQSPAPSLSGSENHSIPQTSRPNTPNNLTLTSIIASQLGDSITTTSTPCSMAVTSSSNHPLASTMLPPPKMNPQSFTSPNNVQGMMPLTPNRSLSPNRGDFPTGAGGNSNGSNSSGGSTGKRANRTRFTDYQIKVLQEFFENNAYPKDDDLEYLSKLLSLSPRVIVVWFQNARQKARKVYENQPAIEPAPGIPDEPGANRFQRTPGLNYQCKKCLLVFQRYYELIRHQKTHCFKEEDAKRSAQAQAAAAQIAAVLSSEDSNSSTTIEQTQQQPPVPQSPQIQAPSQSPVQPNQPTTPTPSGSNFPTSPISTPTPTNDSKEGTFQCDKCNLVFPRFDLWREHQLVHLMNPNLFPSYPPDSPFGILQQHAQLQQLNAAAGMDLANNSGSPIQQHPLMGMLNNAAAAAAAAGQKRKFDDYESESDISDQPKDKRLRTTILPEQLDYLYQKYQIESNPSRKMLENIAREVGLKKRVVQVWFQNTRARERKGQFRAHAQVINKRCPFCPALFKVKSALESHLTTKHADQCSRGEINIDALPDEELSMESAPSFSSGTGGDKFPQTPNMMPPLFPPFHPDMENSIKKYYEESMKRYISELQAHAAATNGDKSEIKPVKEEGEVPLDLSKPVDLSRPMKVNMDHERSLIDPGPLTDLSERSLCDERSDSMSETTEFFDDESNPTSPASSTQSNQRHSQGGGSGGGSGTKRFRTQMSSLQVKVMKSLFHDYKTPTMAECEMLGREIGLPKRVVQVWFQNARAKEKKNKLAMQKMLGTNETDTPKPPDDCKYCAFKYSHKYSVQDHIFTKSHIANVKHHLETQGKDGSVSDGGEFQVPPPPVPGSSGVPPAPGTQPGGGNADSTTAALPQAQTLNNNTHLAQMQLLQMAGMQMAGVQKDKEQQESQDALFQQLYALGGGNAGSAAAGPNFTAPNQFLHPAMFGGANDAKKLDGLFAFS